MNNVWSDFGFSRVTGIIPELTLGQPLVNADALIRSFQENEPLGSSICFTPELSVTGYTCEDWFHSEQLLSETELAIKKIVEYSKSTPQCLIVGAPLRLPDSRLLNGAWVIHQGQVKGVVPKVFLPNTGEFYERRWFVSGRRVHEKVIHPSLGEFWVSTRQIFSHGGAQFGIEICQDLWSPSQPSNLLALSGAQIILNLSASNELVSKATYRRKLCEVQSARLLCGYFYLSSATQESSKDTVFGGHTLAYESGELLGELEPFQNQRKQLTIDFDIDRILNARTKEICFLEAVDEESRSNLIHTHLQQLTPTPKDQKIHTEIKRRVSKQPFIDELESGVRTIEIQAQGLFRRLQSAHAKSMILGISGGLDSTLALRVCERARELSKNTIQLIGVTMPGPGTSEKTLSIARNLLKMIKADQVLEIPIQASVEQHMKDLGKNMEDRSVVFENAQARERTQILFDLANEHQGIVVGTGDLSELALGWCTYNADHMSHYTVNSGVPKTVVKYLVKDWSDSLFGSPLGKTLNEILELPISPELLPPSKDGKIAQMTEAVIGSFELHDFFLYHVLKFGASGKKIQALAKTAFKDDAKLSAEIESTLKLFFKRFFSQQFKRSTLPPGPKVHTVSLSPRSDFRLPDEMSIQPTFD